jgi:two-component system chemotaxis sensor kinase CheA
MSDVLDRKEFIAGYLVEVDEHLRSANGHLLAIETGLPKGEPHHRRVRELFRALHTLKGLSAMVGADPVVELAHEMEAVLRAADQSTGQLSLPAVEALLKGVRAIEARVAAFGAGKSVAPAPHELLDALSTLQPGARPERPAPEAVVGLEPTLFAKLSLSERAQLMPGAGATRRALRIQYQPSPTRTAEGVTISTVRERVAALAEIVKVLPIALPKSESGAGTIAFVLVVLSDRSLEELADAAFVSAAAVVPIEVASIPAAPDADSLDEDGIPDAPLRTNSIRVDIERLDDAIEKLSELVVTRFRLARAVNALRERGVDVREVASILGENARQLRDLRGCITRARMVPVRELLERVPLIVRGMNRSTGKQVRLLIEAGAAELDKSVAERVFPAIVHLVRNAVDHAIEAPAERRSLGKQEQGLVTVSCFQHSNSELEVRVADDGRGIDAAAIAARARRPMPRGDAELLELITLPGFSTLERATSSSGRGMGMDIVQRIAVDTLGGSLTLRTTPRQGSVFALRIPLSISIVDAFAFACGEQAFVVPVSMVDEIIEVDAASVVTPPAPADDVSSRHGSSDNGSSGSGPSGSGSSGSGSSRHASVRKAPLKLVERRGRTMPLISLASLFAIAALPATAQKALVVRQTEHAFAFAVDRMLGQQEIVVRPIDDPLVKMPGVAGSTDLGDGKPTLVLDLVALIGLASRDQPRAIS